MKFQYPPNATPLDQNEIDGLLLPISTQDELNIAEKRAILECISWARNNKKIQEEIISLQGLKKLHKKMFSSVWSWAGTRRTTTTEKNIGVAPHQIDLKIQELCDNTKYRIASIDENSWPEFAAQFHHALVFIHLFPNGNGRHARLATELLSMKLNKLEPSWGGEDINNPTEHRKSYIDALKAADKGEFGKLIKFMFSTEKSEQT